MGKFKIFMDIDGSVIHSFKAMCDVYNYTYYNHPDFVPAKWWLLERYDAKCQCPLTQNVLELFDNPYFFECAEFLSDNTYEVLEELNEIYDVIPTSIGTFTNLSLKTKWIQEKLPFIKQGIFINNGSNTMNKGIIQMSGHIICDDVMSNLVSSNATLKICVGDVYSWNSEWVGYRAVNWTDLGNMLL